MDSGATRGFYQSYGGVAGGLSFGPA
jgi:hypothetical protein